MSRLHPVQPGECLASLAHRYGFGDVRALREHPDNAELVRKRPDPHSLVAGDQVMIPDKEMKTEICTAGRRHLLRVRRPRAWLRLLLRDSDGTPFADKKCRLIIGPSSVEARTDSSGRLEMKIPPGAQSAELVVWMDPEDAQEGVVVVPLRLGHLAPIDTPSGMQSRLAALGYPCGADPEGEAGSGTREALKSFQKDRGLKDSGEPDGPTLEKLQAAYEGA